MKLLKADLHVHTRYSIDCNTPLERIVERCQETGISCVAIADHGTTEGALKMQEIAPFKVIVAEEILTPQGEIMGMFLRQSIPSGLSVTETLAAIREQGGLVCIPHPFDKLRQSALEGKALRELVSQGQVDIIEAFNSRTLMYSSSAKAKNFAQKHGIPASAGSDAHTPDEVGNAYVEMPEFNGRDDFLEALARGKVSGYRTNPLTHIHSVLARLKGTLSV